MSNPFAAYLLLVGGLFCFVFGCMFWNLCLVSKAEKNRKKEAADKREQFRLAHVTKLAGDLVDLKLHHQREINALRGRIGRLEQRFQRAGFKDGDAPDWYAHAMKQHAREKGANKESL